MYATTNADLGASASRRRQRRRRLADPLGSRYRGGIGRHAHTYQHDAYVFVEDNIRTEYGRFAPGRLFSSRYPLSNPVGIG